jgi:ArsR family transcriptional regulator
MELALHQPLDLFAALGERLRLRLSCCLLASKNGLCVCEMVDATGESQPNVSRHLKLLKSAGLVEADRAGRFVYYRLKHAEHPLYDNLRCCLETVCCCEDIQADLRRLRERLKLREGGKCVVGFQKKATRRGGVSKGG